jgi:hypothetical protein
MTTFSPTTTIKVHNLLMKANMKCIKIQDIIKQYAICNYLNFNEIHELIQFTIFLHQSELLTFQLLEVEVMGHDSSVGIVLGYRLDDWGSRVRFGGGGGGNFKVNNPYKN